MKIFTLLASASKQDWHWLNKFVNSPIYNQNVAVTTLFEALRKKMLVLKKTRSSEFFHELLFENKPFDPAKIHHTSNYLLRTIEDYFAWDEWWQDENTRQRYLIQSCRKRGLDRYFREKLEKVRASNDRQPLRHAANYRFRYHLALEDYHHSMQIGRSTAEQLQPISDLHDLAFVAEKLKNACGLLSRQRVQRMELDMGMLPYVLDFVQSRPNLLEYPSVAVYYHGYLALSAPNEDKHFFALKKQLLTAAIQFPLDELRDVYLLAINFCIHHINLREEIYLREVFELYKNGLDSGVFLDNGQISRFTYTNIALAGLRLQEYAWVYTFLHEFREKLPEQQRQGAFSFNLARYYCERRDYALAMPLLLEMDFDDVLHNLTAKAMLVKMYFETDESMALSSLLASLGAYLRRKRQVSVQQRTAYQNFIRLVRKLEATPKHDKAGIALLRAELLETVLVAEKDWLLRMLDK
jgi:hypothetical protein